MPVAPIGTESESLQVVIQQKSRAHRPAFCFIIDQQHVFLDGALRGIHGALITPGRRAWHWRWLYDIDCPPSRRSVTRTQKTARNFRRALLGRGVRHCPVFITFTVTFRVTLPSLLIAVNV